MPAGPHSRLPQTSSAAEGKPTVDNSRSNGGAADLFDRTVPDEPLDVLAQQIVAEVCARENGTRKNSSRSRAAHGPALKRYCFMQGHTIDRGSSCLLRRNRTTRSSE